MQFKTLLESDDAVSPVIGVILMVAITVILAAVIGTFVLGLGDEVQQTSPTSQFSVDYDSAEDGHYRITHEGGETVSQSTLNVSISGGTVFDGSYTWAENSTGSDNQVSAGDGWEIDDDGASANAAAAWDSAGVLDSATVRVIWQAEGGGSSATLKEWTGPNA